MPLGRYNMSDTPQNETDNAPEDVELSSFETNDSIPHSEGGEQVQAESIEQVDEAAVAQEKANAAFNKQYGEKKQLERDLAAQREENSRYQQADRERQAAAVGNIPPMPDSFDYDDDTQYQQAVKNRDDAIIANANYNAQNNAYLQQEQLNQQQAAQAAQQKTSEALQSHSDRVRASGIDANEMLAAENALLNYGIPSDLIVNIAKDADSIEMVKYLAGNTRDGFELANMAKANPYGVGQFLDGIKQKASVLKPKTSNAPSPAANLTGNGVDPSANKYKHSKGVKFY